MNKSFVKLSCMGDTQYNLSELAEVESQVIEDAEIILTTTTGEKISFKLDDIRMEYQDIEEI